jgi:hypothetical protein
MITIHLAGKILLTVATLMYTIAPPIVDLGHTHATNPLWVSHARFHVVWQVFITTGIGYKCCQIHAQIFLIASWFLMATVRLMQLP